MSDRAAALTYYAALSIFPGAIVIVALLKLVGDEGTVEQLLKGVEAITAGGASDTLRRSIQDLVRDNQGAGIALLIALGGSIWTASAYVGGLLRAHSAIVHDQSKTPWLKERALQLGLTAALIVAMALSLVVILASGPLAEGVGATIGVGDVAVDLWRIAKWPALLLVGVAIASLLRMAALGEWSLQGVFSAGSAVGALLWVAASAGFALYVAHFGRFDQTYRSLTAAIVFLLWLYISNVALLYGAELDAVRASANRQHIDSSKSPEEE